MMQATGSWPAWQNGRTDGRTTAPAPAPAHSPSDVPKWVQPTNHKLPDLSWPAPPPGLSWPAELSPTTQYPPGLPPGLAHPGRVSPVHQFSRSMSDVGRPDRPARPKSLPDRPRTPPGRLERIGRLSIDSATGLNALSPEFRPSPRARETTLPPEIVDAARALDSAVGRDAKTPLTRRRDSAITAATPSANDQATQDRGSDEALEIDGFLDELDGAGRPAPVWTAPVAPVERVDVVPAVGTADSGTQTDPLPVRSYDYDESMTAMDTPKAAVKPLVGRLDALFKPPAEVASFTILPSTRPIVKISNMSPHTSAQHIEEVLPYECLPSRTDSGVSIIFACEPKTGFPRSFAFIEVLDESTCDDVVSALNGLEVLGRFLVAQRASPGELLEALFPISTRWFAYGQRIASTSKDPAEMTPEIVLAARMAIGPRSRFHYELPSRPFTAFASLIARYPWHQSALWTRPMANALYTISLSVLQALLRQLDRFPGSLSAVVALVIAMTRCPAFSSVQIRHLRSLWTRARPHLAHAEEQLSPPCYAAPSVFVVQSASGEEVATVPVVPVAPVKRGPPTVWPMEILCQLAELHLDIGSFESARASSQWLLNAMAVARHWRDALLPMLCSFAAIGPVRTSLLAFYESPLLAHDDLGMDMLGHLRVQLVGGEASQQVVRCILAYAPRLSLLALDSEADVDRTLFDAIPDELLVLELRGAALSVRAVTLVNRLLRLERLGLGSGAAPTTVRLLSSICARRGIVLTHL